MIKIKFILAVLLSFGLIFSSAVSYGRYSAIMIDADSGKVLQDINATQPWYPASLTKVMTLYMAFEALKTGRLHLYESLNASYHASRQPTSKLGLRSGERLTVEDAILAVITRSANDAAVVLAEHLGGTEENFAQQMTEKARSLGMSNTRFMNATGLPNDWQVTTSRDMAILAWKIQRNFPQYYPYFSSQEFYFKGRELHGINKFTKKYPGAEGMKTGYTCGSGFNLMSSAQQNGKRLIGVVLGGMTSAERYRLMTDMMDNGFSNIYSPKAGTSIYTMPASYGGEPPYQLNCGKGARGYKVAADENPSVSRHQVKKSRSSRKAAQKPKYAAANKKRYHKYKTTKVAKSKRSNTKRLASGQKKSTVTKSKVVAKKSVGKSKVASSRKTKTIAKSSTKSSKSRKVSASSSEKPVASSKTSRNSS